MEAISLPIWHPLLLDPSGQREAKPRDKGLTMVIDKGLGIRAFADLMGTSSAHIDLIKLGFGTSALYPVEILKQKIEIAKAHNVLILPGGTFLEVAVTKGQTDAYFETIQGLGFNAVEVSDGTIEMDRKTRIGLILEGKRRQLEVFTEYGKKCWGSSIEIEELIQTVECDLEFGAKLVTIEGRESGMGVGIFDEKGQCKEDDFALIVKRLPHLNRIMWETPLKSQQSQLLNMLGSQIHLGNIAPEDVFSLEALRRGLRSDTFQFGEQLHYYI
ncbi:phosphosulfolactate synthase [Paenibacillus swuensis]|uniref:Phosphosulfolactate synthase n=1 Tax=Paenibacillus swuensis TaxID=1178515 RepID=A0A172TM14_9BACL|nr:phosphosulfolactate synthase [Paenibacillus swuensis]ANE48081.1 phosphosulfolactate synthase [Paenibacillus swuensis]